MFKFSVASLRHREGIDERLIRISDLALELSPIDFGIPKTGGLRTKDTQYALFCDGKSRCDGTKVLSKHQAGRALDVYAWVDGASWDEQHLTTVALAFLQAAQILNIRLKWGGFWQGTSRDMPHFELAD